MYGKLSTSVEIEENFKCVYVYMYFSILYIPIYTPVCVYIFLYIIYTYT